MASIRFNLERKTAERGLLIPEMPLLWYLRDSLGMTGTKIRLRHGSLRRGTVHVDGQVPSVPASHQLASLNGKSVTTIEGLSPDGRHPVQQAWIESDVPPCGFGQSGQIMAAASLLAKKSPSPPTPISTK